ncbi:MAG: Fic family protein [Alphaproteobacteria bacterium]|nr:Fic family protein [Alphaproteobacteria bacterium]
MLNKRQKMIFNYIEQSGAVSREQIQEAVSKEFEKCSKVTILRDLDVLIAEGLISKTGTTKSALYALSIKNKLLSEVDVEAYFANDERKLENNRFNFEIMSHLSNLLTPKEQQEYAHLNEQYLKSRAGMSPTILRKEFERLTIELAWKSSKIEGNTYTLLDTERLLKDNVSADGKTEQETQMIINHKKALDYIIGNTNEYKELTVRKIEELHRLLVEGLGVSYGVRQTLVGIVGTDYKPLDNEFQIKEALEQLVKLVNQTENPLEKALITVLMISYIQPFEDGNKRTSRILGNALLLANDYCPLSYKSVDEVEYKKGVILFYEQNNASYFKKLFLEQYQQAVKKYFE